MRENLSLGLCIFAGLHFFFASEFAFIDGAAFGPNGGLFGGYGKWLPILIYTVTGVLSLVGGLAMMGFQDWRRDAGFVLLSAPGITTLSVFMIAIKKEEYLKTMPDSVLMFLSDYTSGAAVIGVLALAGALLVITSRLGSGIRVHDFGKRKD
jgi:hypothetical protein